MQTDRKTNRNTENRIAKNRQTEKQPRKKKKGGRDKTKKRNYL